MNWETNYPTAGIIFSVVVLPAQIELLVYLMLKSKFW